MNQILHEIEEIENRISDIRWIWTDDSPILQMYQDNMVTHLRDRLKQLERQLDDEILYESEISR